MDKKLIQGALNTLEEDACEINWDNCWDTLEELNDNCIDCVDILLNGLNARSSSAVLYAIAGLEKIHFCFDGIHNQVIRLLKHEDYEVRLSILKIIKKYHITGADIFEALLNVVRDGSEHIILRIKAYWLILWRKKESDMTG